MEALATVTQTVTSALSPLLPFLLVAPLLVAILWWRTGSIYGVLDRLWLLTVGKGDVQDGVIRSMLQQGKDLDRLKYSLGVKKIDTVSQAHRLDAWMKRNAVGHAELRSIGSWIDGRSSELLIQPPKHTTPIMIAFAVMAFVAMGGAAIFGGSQSAFLKMRQSGVWFKADGTTIQSPLGNWSVNQASCKDGPAALVLESGFTESEGAALCKAVEDGELRELVKQARTSQEWVGYSVICISALFLYMCVMGLIGIDGANRLRRRLSLVEAPDGGGLNAISSESSSGTSRDAGFKGTG